MKQDLYRDLFNIEDSHWWNKSKRILTTVYIQKKVNERLKLKLLDIGCGTGVNLQNLNKFGTSWGIDIAPEAIKFCKVRGLKRVMVADALKTPFRDSFFDIVTAHDIMEHLDDHKFLQEVGRILKSRGLLILTVPACKILWSKWDVILSHKRRYSKIELKNIIRLYGFHPDRVTYLYSFLFFPILLIRSVKSHFYDSNYPSDFKINNKLFNSFLGMLAKLERIILKFIDIPIGTSLFAVLVNQKNKNND